MAVLVKNEDYIQQLCLVSAAGVTCIIGLMIHFFIVGVSVIDWLKRRPLTTADLLITSIGASRIVFQFFLLFDLFWRTFSKKYSTAYDITINVFVNSSTYCNIWLSVLLSVFYSLKISNFHNVLFLYLRKIISQRALVLIIMSVLLSIGFSLAELLESFENTSKNSTQESNIYVAKTITFTMFMYLLWNTLAFFIYVISCFSILGSLCCHIIRMKRDINVTSHLDAYFKIMKFTIVSFFYFALYISINIFGIYYYTFIGIAGAFLVWNCFPMLHSIYLIYMTARLRSHFSKIFHGVTKCLLFGRGSEFRSGVQIEIINNQTN